MAKGPLPLAETVPAKIPGSASRIKGLSPNTGFGFLRFILIVDGILRRFLTE